MESKTISQMFFNTVDKYSDKNLYYHKADNKWIGINGSEVKSTVQSLVKEGKLKVDIDTCKQAINQGTKKQEFRILVCFWN